ncbi:MAG: hypothetical protein JNJ50_00655 [Acidobacteria bacterium]|nr:hypothetical protein [Acidobacteriota bacterium]
MKTQPKAILAGVSWLSRTWAGALLLSLVFSYNAFAQSVEKAETSQQARAADSELERAKAIVNKPQDNKPSKPETGRTWGVYSTTNTLELGYRFVDTKGSNERYLSDVNVRDGFRVLESSLDMRAQPGTGILFDFLHADVNNAGGDQSQNFSLRLDKTKWYRFDGNVRRFNYFRSPGPNFALGFRDYDLRQQVSDFSLRLFPQRKIRINAGYGRSMAKGRYNPTYSFQRDIFQLFGDTRWEANDYRLGLDATHRKWDFNVEQLYRQFRNDQEITSRPGGDLGFNPTDNGRITLLDRLTPQRSRSLVTRASVRGSIGDRLHVVLRGLHDDERMKAGYYEIASGRDNNGVTLVSNVLTLPGQGGIIERPSNKVDAGLSLDLSRHLTLSNTFSYTSFKIAGDTEILTTAIRQPATGPQTTTVSRIQATDYITDLTSYWNTLALDLNFGRKFSANVGWRAMQRDVKINSRYFVATSATSATNPALTDEGESIGTHAFIGGVRFRPTQQTSFMFDVEKGQNNNAFVRINPLDYTRFRARAQVQATDKLAFSGTFTSLDRTNPTPQVNNDSNSRSYTIAVNWEPRSRVLIDAGYDYHDLNARGDILYTTVINGTTQRVSGKSIYYARINSLYTNARFGLTNRLDMIMVYYYIMDRGAPAVSLGANDVVNAYPLRRHNPEARLAYRFSNHVTGNLSYRHYSYNEKDFSVQDYRSNILTSSLRFTF